MPDLLVLLRHGESDGNVAASRDRKGDQSLFTPQFRQTPGSRWRLTDVGRAQAAAAGRWLRDSVGGFDLHYVSPYARTMETAARLGLPNARWRLNRALRERDYGDIGSLPRTEAATAPWWAHNHNLADRDRLYWTPPNGESIAAVAEDRVRNVLDTLHRDADAQRVLVVTHGETMLAFRLVLERLDDTQFAHVAHDSAHRIPNCGALQYTRRDPATGVQDRQLRWLRRASPARSGSGWAMHATAWQRIETPTRSNADLLNLATGE